MNICSTSVLIAPHVAVPQVMNSDAALYSVTIPETCSSKSHFHISCYLEGRNGITKVAAMVDSGAATSLFIDHKFASQHQMLKEPLENLIWLFNIDGSLNKAGSITHKVRLNLRPPPVFTAPGLPLTSINTLDQDSPICQAGAKALHQFTFDLQKYKQDYKETIPLRSIPIEAHGEDISHKQQGQQCGKSVDQAEGGPLQLYHPWETRSISVSATCSPSLKPKGFVLNEGTEYIPFKVVDKGG